jgi:hypothetical protein
MLSAGSGGEEFMKRLICKRFGERFLAVSRLEMTINFDIKETG